MKTVPKCLLGRAKYSQAQCWALVVRETNPSSQFLQRINKQFLSIRRKRVKRKKKVVVFDHINGGEQADPSTLRSGCQMGRLSWSHRPPLRLLFLRRRFWRPPPLQSVFFLFYFFIHLPIHSSFWFPVKFWIFVFAHFLGKQTGLILQSAWREGGIRLFSYGFSFVWF